MMSFIDFLSVQDPLKDHACVSCHDFVKPLFCFNFEQFLNPLILNAFSSVIALTFFRVQVSFLQNVS